MKWTNQNKNNSDIDTSEKENMKKDSFGKGKLKRRI